MRDEKSMYALGKDPRRYYDWVARVDNCLEYLYRVRTLSLLKKCVCMWGGRGGGLITKVIASNQCMHIILSYKNTSYLSYL